MNSFEEAIQKIFELEDVDVFENADFFVPLIDELIPEFEKNLF